ncbi:hypothetical protein ES705_15244 [subsurface metagenome]
MKNMLDLIKTSFVNILTSIHALDPYPDHNCIEYRSMDDLLSKLQARLWHNKDKQK